MKKIQQLILHPEKKIITKPSRTIAGVAPVAIMTRPEKCPHGTCIFCPGGPGSYFGNIPQSYTGNEPASMRAVRNNFDPYLQVFNRLEHYALLGQDFSKAEVIIMSGTFLAVDAAYREEFIAYIFKAFNDFSNLFFKDGRLVFQRLKEFFELDGEFKNPTRIQRVQQRILQCKGTSSLREEQLKNENAASRVVALCIETKPDYCRQENIQEALRLGCTRMELGVQNLNDKSLHFANRGHSVADTIAATQQLKNAFLKVTYHVMPGLPCSSKEQDVEMFKEFFLNPAYQPDSLKIYPCMVMPGTGLYGLWKQGKFQPLTTAEATEIIVAAKQHIPEYCRVMRIQRDIPTKVTAAGVDKTNLRQYVAELLQKKNIRCRCIRCREPRGKQINWGAVRLKRIDYGASGGHEVFLTFEDAKQDLLLGFARLRVVGNLAGIRELHVYGQATAFGKEGEVQHRGLGRRLMEEAERIAAEEFRCRKMVVISGIGVREYYRNMGYRDDGRYVSKSL